MASKKQLRPGNIRNVCILAHVDHGKSSYADSLLASNNIISSRMAGQLRYLDSRPDEQERGITMESSAVSLAYSVISKNGEQQDYRINVIDTPGHVDFSSEVSTASRLCDGALVLVDAVEGVCTQTISVLRQAWNERLKPLLVINKMDRLITELKLSPSEGYHHLVRLIEQVNAVIGTFFASERMEDDLRWREERERRVEQRNTQLADSLAQSVNQSNEVDDDVEVEFEERDDEDIYFDPAKGDVLFASAVDQWSFGISKFASLWAKKLGIRESNLSRCLWGDFYFDPKSKRVLTRKGVGSRNLKPMFVQFVLDHVWAAYDAIIVNPDQGKVEKIIKALELKIRPQELKSKDSKSLLISIFSQWLPLASSTFRAVVEKIPCPSEAQAYRLPKMLHPELITQGFGARRSDKAKTEPKSKLEFDLYNGVPGLDKFKVAYVSKMFAIPTEELPQFQRKQLTAEEMRQRGRQQRAVKLYSKEDEGVNIDESALPSLHSSTEDVVDTHESQESTETLIGFARLYSGTITTSHTLTCLLPKYNTSMPRDHARNVKFRTEVHIEHLYMIMGRELVVVDQVQAGNVFGIGGLDGKVLRNATLCCPPQNYCGLDQDYLVNLGGLHLMAAPIVKISIEPKQPSDMPRLVEGLRLLNQADPCVETFVQDTGEHVIVGAGELHLERCLRDLRERFAKIKIQASKPIVPFRETCIKGNDMTPSRVKDGARGTVHGTVSDGFIQFTIRVQPLPLTICNWINRFPQQIKNLHSMVTSDRKEFEFDEGGVTIDQNLDSNEKEGLNECFVTPDETWESLDRLFKESEQREWEGVADKVWSFGPRRVGANLLLDKTPGSIRALRQRRIQKGLDSNVGSGTATPTSKHQAQMSSTLDLDENGKDINKSKGEIAVREFDECIETAFQIATLRGPLCAEPMVGIVISLERFELDLSQDVSLESIRSKWSQLTGSVISTFKDAIHSAILDWSPRLLLAMYSCDIQASSEVLGKVYGVVSRRRGTIISEEMKEGSTFYSINAKIPVIESFGFADEIRKRTSGAASPQLVYAGFELLDQDPFWVPTTEEELEDLGEKSDRENVARKYMDQVRKRKGMFVDKKIVQHAEKQRTMKR